MLYTQGQSSRIEGLMGYLKSKKTLFLCWFALLRAVPVSLPAAGSPAPFFTHGVRHPCE
jgi:hypothetical protein